MSSSKPWPIRLQLGDQEIHLDRTAAVALEALPELVKKKAAKGWELCCLSRAQGYAEGQYEVIWKRILAPAR